MEYFNWINAIVHSIALCVNTHNLLAREKRLKMFLCVSLYQPASCILDAVTRTVFVCFVIVNGRCVMIGLCFGPNILLTFLSWWMENVRCSVFTFSREFYSSCCFCCGAKEEASYVLLRSFVYVRVTETNKCVLTMITAALSSRDQPKQKPGLSCCCVFFDKFVFLFRFRSVSHSYGILRLVISSRIHSHYAHVRLGSVHLTHKYITGLR